MKWLTLVYWIEPNESWTPNQTPDQHRIIDALDYDDAIGQAVEYYGADYDSNDSDDSDGYGAYMAVPIEGRPTRARVRRTVELIPV